MAASSFCRDVIGKSTLWGYERKLIFFPVMNSKRVIVDVGVAPPDRAGGRFCGATAFHAIAIKPPRGALGLHRAREHGFRRHVGVENVDCALDVAAVEVRLGAIVDDGEAGSR